MLLCIFKYLLFSGDYCCSNNYWLWRHVSGDSLERAPVDLWPVHLYDMACYLAAWLSYDVTK